MTNEQLVFRIINLQSMPIEDSPFLIVVGLLSNLLSTVRDLHQYVHHQDTKPVNVCQIFVILTQHFCQRKLGVHARLSTC